MTCSVLCGPSVSFDWKVEYESGDLGKEKKSDFRAVKLHFTHCLCYSVSVVINKS